MSTFYRQWLNFVLKDVYKKEIVKNYGWVIDTKKQMFFINTLAGALTGSSVLLASYPFDMARIRLAAELAPQNRKLFRSTFGVWKFILETDGFQGLYRGAGASLFGLAIH